MSSVTISAAATTQDDRGKMQKMHMLERRQERKTKNTTILQCGGYNLHAPSSFRRPTTTASHLHLQDQLRSKRIGQEVFKSPQKPSKALKAFKLHKSREKKRRKHKNSCYSQLLPLPCKPTTADTPI